MSARLELKKLNWLVLVKLEVLVGLFSSKLNGVCNAHRDFNQTHRGSFHTTSVIRKPLNLPHNCYWIACILYTSSHPLNFELLCYNVMLILFQTMRTKVVLKHESTRDTGLTDDWASCVLSSSKTVVGDKESGSGKWNLHFFNPDGKLTGRDTRIMCRYHYHNLLSVVIGNTEYIAASCLECATICVINPQDQSQEPIVTYKGERGEIGPMCLGRKGTLYVMGSSRGHEKNHQNSALSLLDCKTTKFTKLSLFRNFQPARDICYIERHDLIVVNTWYPTFRICAVKSSDGNRVWDIPSGEWKPKGITYLCEQDLLLAGTVKLSIYF